MARRGVSDTWSDADAREAQRLELVCDSLVAAVGCFAETTVQLNQGCQVLGVREAPATGACAEAGGRVARNAPQEDVLVLPVARALRAGAAEEDDVVMRQQRRRDRDVEGLVVAHGAKIA